MNRMQCLWVGYNEFGTDKHCPDVSTFTDMKATYPKLNRFALRDKFCESNCRYCLEGQKIEAMNDFRTVLHSIGNELLGNDIGETKVIKTIIKKLMSV